MINQLTYYNLDSIENREILSKNLLLLEDELRKRYIQRLELFNKENLEHNPEPFRFFNKENCTVLSFIIPYEFNNSHSCNTFFLSTPLNRKETVIVLDYDDLFDLDSYTNTNDFFYQKILPQHNFERTQIIFSTIDFYNNKKHDFSLFNESFNTERHIQTSALNDFVIRSIQQEVSAFQAINNKPLSYFAKDVYKFPFSIIDLKPLIALVDDRDFTYQLDQAMAAYHENLFLPCASTLGVVLETLCIKILEDNGINKIKSGDTQLGKLRERLINERIITRRDNTRLEVAYKMRNMASHSSPGVALKEDCHFMLNVINTLAFDYLDTDQ